MGHTTLIHCQLNIRVLGIDSVGDEFLFICDDSEQPQMVSRLKRKHGASTLGSNKEQTPSQFSAVLI